jgi:preprotein translocase subunit SecF
MDFFKIETHIDFLKPRKIAFAISAADRVSLVSLATRGLNFGIEFRGGVVIEAGFPSRWTCRRSARRWKRPASIAASCSTSAVRARSPCSCWPRRPKILAATRERIMQILRTVDAERRAAAGRVRRPAGRPRAGGAGRAGHLFALLMILAYVSFRFQWKFSVGAVAALVHDVIITLGFFSMLQLAFDLAVLAAVLAVIGYSLNDTIVIFDRIRENMLKMRRKSTEEVVNASLNQTLSRTIMTGVTTLLVLLALYFLGGEAISGFSIALIVGVLIGTYSSIYIASETAMALKVSTTDLLPPQPKDEDSGVMP